MSPVQRVAHSSVQLNTLPRALLQRMDVLCSVLQGILQGMGKQSLVAIYNTVAYWGVGMTIAYTATINAGLGIQGLWIGLLCAVAGEGEFIQVSHGSVDWLVCMFQAHANA
jgi:Na+-driven multidrug efflux pump